MGRAHDFKTEALTEVNLHIAEVATDLVAPEAAGWDFFCECGGRDCYATVRLTLAEYMAIRESAAAILAPGHELNLSARAARARERARERRREAQALWAQAEQQRRRARRNLP